MWRCWHYWPPRWRCRRARWRSNRRPRERPSRKPNALEARRALPKRTLFDERDADDGLMLAAMIAARMDRYPEAQQIMQPVLKFHRDLYARGKDNDDALQHAQFARALYVSALAAPGQRTTELAQAVAILDGLPPAMRRLVSNARLRESIAEEQKTRR